MQVVINKTKTRIGCCLLTERLNDDIPFNSKIRLFTVPYFSVRSYMSIESNRPASWSLDASETGESTKCPWVGEMGLKAWG